MVLIPKYKNSSYTYLINPAYTQLISHVYNFYEIPTKYMLSSLLQHGQRISCIANDLPRCLICSQDIKQWQGDIDFIFEWKGVRLPKG